MSSNLIKRLQADLKKLQDEPIQLANARPNEKKGDMTLWDGTISVEIDVTHLGKIQVPLHFLIDFPADYPASAPNIGFSFEFPYRNGASYTESSGRLKGKKVICLDVLGNFQSYHTEWKSSEGSGWSPAYNVTTLLVNLQSVLVNLNADINQRERDQLYSTAAAFGEKNPGSVLEVMDEDEIKDRARVRRTKVRLNSVFRGDEALVQQAICFMKRAGCAVDGGDTAAAEEFLLMLEAVHSAVNVPSSLKPMMKEVDENICCYSSGKLYTEALLGVGIQEAKNNITSPAEFLAHNAFKGGLRQTTSKAPFTDFMPVWVNKEHACESKKWVELVKSQTELIGGKFFRSRTLEEAVLEVFPRLINQMIVEIMRPDTPKSAAISTFEALCNFWRTLRWFVETQEDVRREVQRRLVKFVKSEQCRHKDNTQDLGMMLVLYTVYQGYPDCPTRTQFIDAYVDENSVRWVMWWQRSNTPPKDKPVFEATKVSRDILMFNMMVVDIIIGDVAPTLELMEETNCRMPQRLETLQQEWRKASQATTSWKLFFAQLRASMPPAQSPDAWIQTCVSRAAEKGPKYGSGGGKGGGKGKGKYSR